MISNTHTFKKGKTPQFRFKVQDFAIASDYGLEKIAPKDVLKFHVHTSRECDIMSLVTLCLEIMIGVEFCTLNKRTSNYILCKFEENQEEKFREKTH